MVPEASRLFPPAKPEPHRRGSNDAFVYPVATFGNSIASVPFVWTYLDQQFDMRLLAGFCGVSYDPVTGLLRAEIGWGVKDPKAGEPPEQDVFKEFWDNVHQSGRPAKR